MADQESPKAKGRRISTLNAKKKMASKLGESKIGRATLVKLMGPEADAIVSALKEAVVKMDNKNKAKELKKDIFKWVLKASVLIQNKNLHKDNTSHLRRPIQLAAERLIDICDRVPAGKRDLSEVSKEFKDVAVLLRKVLEPHCQDKNADKVVNIINYYADLNFLNRFMNEDIAAQERETILTSLRHMLLPFPSVLFDQESIDSALLRAVNIQSEIRNPSLAMCLGQEHPQLSSLFAVYVDALDNKALGQSVRFIMAEHEFTLISAANIRASRARILYNKYLATPPVPGGEMLSSNNELLNKLQEQIDDERTPKLAFQDIRSELLEKLEKPFADFLKSEDFLHYKAHLQAEVDDLEELYGDKFSVALSIINVSNGAMNKARPSHNTSAKAGCALPSTASTTAV
mmetsp:Transcript_15222/g.29536  ORF Transcript_15222/g.29536 Transcript_15222/m.29536 type:complete len:403 (+) Transcript_15222:1241-2449(+)|eukprot:CAMPEP_0171494388 /NCGR_PEP_ID=MMETSP0958-20121227/5518_1 /TAXON_ID=87120 /ORGANISM="Aurantiochytrium limacinum, Strain ATCCMYA-1381" /LENGTH=402 /DNA_ID=CAMNT_0012028173 /DNA_START=1070 /DNA_END=2278 /DNA_ORIENTATION=-